jgi:hypothetical protein
MLRPSPSPTADRVPRSWGAVADAIGAGVLVFAFAPILASVPWWLSFEATNRLNARDPVVLAFVPVRGIVFLLDAFRDGAVQGVVAGAIFGVLCCVWTAWRSGLPPQRERIALGATTGALAAGVMLLLTVPLGIVAPGRPPASGAIGEVPAFAGLRAVRTVSFEVVAGMLCGMVAAPMVLGLASGARVSARTTRSAHVLHVAWSSACLLALVVLIGARWLRYTTWSSLPALDHALRETMVVDEQAFLYLWAWTTVKLPTLLLAAAVVVVGLHRRLLDQLLRREDGRWRLTPLAVSAALGLMAWLHYLFDVNPTVAVVGGASVGLAWVLGRARVPSRAALAVWAGLFLGALLAAGDLADRLTIAAWALFLFGTQRYLAARLRSGDLALLRALALMPANLLPAVLPMLVPLHGGTLLGPGFAYSFCEVPGRGSLYAAIPQCDTPLTDYDACRGGRIVEYDLTSMKPAAEYALFSPSFYGRLEQLACFDDQIQVAVQSLVYQGRDVVQGVVSLPVSSPRDFTVLTADKGIGTAIAYDAAHDAVFYSGEFDNPLVRYDRRTKAFDDAPGRDLLRHWVEPVSLKANTASLGLNTSSIHPARNRLYVTEWLQGRYAYAIDLTTLRVVARYDAGGGGAMAISVDPERDRLFVSSMWGLEVFDLATGALIARKRTGPGNRPVVVDAARNRLYLSSSVEGKIRILDRDTLAVIGQVPIGFGSRYVYLSRDGKRLFASSKSAHYYWDADTLPPRRG